MDIQKNNELIIRCECGTDILMVHEWREKYSDVQRQTFDLAMFSYGQYQNKPSFIERLKYCWRHLRTGKIFSDEIIMTPKDAKKLADFINSRLEDFKAEEEILKVI